MIISSSLPLLTIINLYQVLRSHLGRNNYIFISAEQFKNQEIAEAIDEAFHSITYPALIIDCSCEYDKVETELWSTLNKFNEKRIIFVAGNDVARSLEEKFKKFEATIKPDKKYDWGDLTSESQIELLKKTVHFQGSPVSLNKLVSAESPVTKFLPLADLLNKTPLEICRAFLTSTTEGVIENYYIPRTYNHQGVNKNDVFGKQFSD
jgi:hypothetical protein